MTTRRDAVKAMIKAAGAYAPARLLAFGSGGFLLAACESGTDPDPDPDPDPSGLTTIALTVRRLDGGSGATLVSSGIPLKPGQLTLENLSKVRVKIGDVEQAVAVAALSGRYADGSLYAVLVQFNTAVSSGTPVTATLEIGAARATTDLTLTTPSGAHAGAASWPSSAEHFAGVSWLPSVGPRSTTPTAYANFDKAWDDWSATRFAGANAFVEKWDRGYSCMGQLFRDPNNAASATWFKVAMKCADDYRIAGDASLASNGYINQPGQSTIMFGLAWHYWFTGNEASRTNLVREALNQMGPVTDPAFKYPDGRINYWTFLGATLAAMLDTTVQEPFNKYGPYTRAQMVTGISKLIDVTIAEQVTSTGPGPIALSRSAVNGTTDSDNVSNVGWWLYSPPTASDIPDAKRDVNYYMCGMVAMGMIWSVELLPELSTKKAAVLASIKAMCDGAIASGNKTWDATSKQFKYQTGVPWPPPVNGGAWFVNVNPWLSQAFAWLYKQTGTAIYKTWAPQRGAPITTAAELVI
jgi:hypothetical protein